MTRRRNPAFIAAMQRHPAGKALTTQSRPRKAERHNTFGLALVITLLINTLWLAVVIGLFILAMYIVISALFGMDPLARADTAWVREYGPSVCDALNHQPTTAEMNRLVMDMLRAGMDPEAIGTGIAESVWQTCPQHIALIDAYLDEYAGVAT